VHLQPVEFYPPVLNLIRYLESTGRWKISVHTTGAGKRRKRLVATKALIHRTGSLTEGSRLSRALRYIQFHLSTTLRLLRDEPDVVLYYETASSLPVIPLRLKKSNLSVFVHYHEYTSPAHLRDPGMRATRAIQPLEMRRLLRRANWISHTNQDRLDLFFRDYPMANKDAGRLLPNLPPAVWSHGEPAKWPRNGEPLRFVYVGSLSVNDTYIKEVLAWMKELPKGSVSLDIYAYNADEAARALLGENADAFVRFFPEGVEYQDLPEILRQYHVGLILYKAASLNYRFNASNKLFEYLTCGLDVLFPSTMLGVKPFASASTAPRVIEVDFESGTFPTLEAIANRPQQTSPLPFSNAESVLADLDSAMMASLQDDDDD
jgi:hypothetical protein